MSIAELQADLRVAAQVLDSRGYSCENKDGKLVVQDPVYNSEPGRTDLVLAGYQPVVIRNYIAASRFLRERS
jgi:hypothetical protein